MRPRLRVALWGTAMVTAAAGAAGGAAKPGKVPGKGAAEPYWRGREVSPGPFLALGPAAVGVKVVCDRWPDGSDLRQFGLDAIRLSGAKTDQEKAVAVWRWVRRWTMYTNGNAPTEKALKRSYIDDPVKVLNVYGTHWCDGLSRAMEMVWRALGGRAEKLYRGGHTMCNVFYRDADGVERWHLFDVSEGGYMYHRSLTRLLGPDEMSLDIYNYMQNWVHCAHLPWPTHRVEVSLRRGESVARLWGNEGAPYQDNVRYDHQTVPATERGPYKIGYGNGRLIYEVPTADAEAWRDGLAAEPVGMVCRDGALRPAEPGRAASAQWRIRSPYVIARAFVEVEGERASDRDVVRLLLSLDEGRSWREVWRAGGTGGFASGPIDICPTYGVTMKADPPEGFFSPFGRYAYRLKLQMQSSGGAGGVAVRRLVFRTVFQHNIYHLPQLQPGRNRITVSGRLAPDAALEVTYLWDDLSGKGRRNVTIVESTPYTYEILADGRRWEDVVCRSITVRAVAGTGEGNRTVVKERPCPLRPPPPMSRPDTTRHRWRRPVEEPMRSLEEYLAVLADERADARQAILALNDLADTRAFEALERAVYHRFRRQEKERAIVALYNTDPRRAIPVLLDVLYHPEKVRWKEDPRNPAVRIGHWCGMASLIGAIMAREGRREAVPGLVSALEHPHCWRDARWGLLRALGRLGDPRARRAVRRFLRARDGDTVAIAAWAAGRVGDEEAVPRLRRLLDSDYEVSVQHAAESLGILGDRGSAPRLRALLEHPDEDVRAAAAGALGRLGDRKAVAALRRLAAEDPFLWVRARAVQALEAVSRSPAD